MKQSMIFKTISLSAFLLFAVGCSQKSETSYYMPQLKVRSEGLSKTDVRTFESSAYLAGDKIWYKKNELFMPYKNSFFAKTPREYIVQSVEAMGLGSPVSIKLIDAYQLYADGGSSFVLLISVDAGKHKLYTVKKDGLGIGPAEAVKGFESAVDELCERIKIDFGGNK